MSSLEAIKRLVSGEGARERRSLTALLCHAPAPLARVVLPSSIAVLLLLPAAPPALAEKHPDLGGEKLTNELCLGCHDAVSSEIATKPHGAIEQGCTACHDVLKAAAPPYLAGGFQEVCGACHDLTDKEIVKKHGGQPFASVACTKCHLPHGSTNKALLLPFAHSPFLEGQCDACHEAPQDGAIKLVAENVQEICVTCHEDLQKKFAGSKVVHAVIESDGCASCHSPHATVNPAHLREPASSLCLGCHDDVAEQLKMKTSHPPAKDPGCQACHDPHASNFTARLRTDPTTVCLGCHHAPLVPGAAVPQSVQTAPGFSVAGSYLQKVRQINLDSRNVGHPIFSHPVNGRPDPLRKGMELGCLSCHVPHGTDAPKLLAFTVAPGMGVCQKCHQM